MSFPQTAPTDATQDQQIECFDFGGLQVATEGLQNEYQIRKRVGANRPNTLRWLSQSHRDEILTYFWSSVFKRFSYHRSVQTGPLYKDIGAVISLITSLRFTEANEFGDNFLNGQKLLMEINCSKNLGRQLWVYQPLQHVGFSQVLHVRPSVVWTIESSISRHRLWTTSMDGFTVVYRQLPQTTLLSSKEDLVSCIPYSCLRKLCQSLQ